MIFPLSLLESLHIALSGLAANRLRVALTTLGIIIGVTAVIAQEDYEEAQNS